jgi:hypothetical protein
MESERRRERRILGGRVRFEGAPRRDVASGGREHDESASAITP